LSPFSRKSSWFQIARLFQVQLPEVSRNLLDYNKPSAPRSLEDDDFSDAAEKRTYTKRFLFYNSKLYTETRDGSVKDAKANLAHSLKKAGGSEDS